MYTPSLTGLTANLRHHLENPQFQLGYRFFLLHHLYTRDYIQVSVRDSEAVARVEMLSTQPGTRSEARIEPSTLSEGATGVRNKDH